jgi:hypothetical protein
MFRQDCSCPALLEDCRSGFPYGAVTRYGPPFQTLPVPKSTAAGLVRFRSPLLAESRLMSVPPATEMFQFAGFASRTYEFSAGYPLPGGLPHSEIPGSTIARISPGLFAACRVLHRLSVPRHPPDALLSRSITRDAHPADDPKITRTASRPPENRRAQGQAPPSLDRGATPPAATRMKTLLRTALHRFAPHRATAPQDNKPMPRPVRLGHIHKSALPFNQRQPRNPGRRRGTMPARPPRNRNQTWSSPNVGAQVRSSAHIEQNRPALLRLLISARVEVNGIEPMTSCLQSRRSPN